MIHSEMNMSLKRQIYQKINRDGWNCRLSGVWERDHVIFSGSITLSMYILSDLSSSDAKPNMSPLRMICNKPEAAQAAPPGPTSCWIALKICKTREGSDVVNGITGQIYRLPTGLRAMPSQLAPP